MRYVLARLVLISLVLALGLFVSIASVIPNAAALEDGTCGEAVTVDSFVVELDYVTLSFPSLLEIRVGGRLVYERDSWLAERRLLDWAPPYNGVRIARWSDYILLEIYEQDCIDLLSRELVILRSSGDLVLSQPIWSNFWKEAFYSEGDLLVYWSEAFCLARGGEPALTYVYAWDGSGSFEKEPKLYEDYCLPDVSKPARRESIEFQDLIPNLRGAQDD